MNIENLQAYCMSKKGVTESFPFDNVTLVFKVMGKIFAILPLDAESLQISLKADPDLVLEWREKYPDVREGYHLNKKHWNTVYVQGSISDNFLKTMIDHSYESVVKGLKKTEREALNQL